MAAIDTEVRHDGELLADILQLLDARVPLNAWRADAIAALAGAIASPGDNSIERAKAERLERHLFAGPWPDNLARAPAVPSRRADRVRADLADLVAPGAGLYLVAYVG